MRSRPRSSASLTTAANSPRAIRLDHDSSGWLSAKPSPALARARWSDGRAPVGASPCSAAGAPDRGAEPGCSCPTTASLPERASGAGRSAAGAVAKSSIDSPAPRTSRRSCDSPLTSTTPSCICNAKRPRAASKPRRNAVPLTATVNGPASKRHELPSRRLTETSISPLARATRAPCESIASTAIFVLGVRFTRERSENTSWAGAFAGAAMPCSVPTDEPSSTKCRGASGAISRWYRIQSAVMPTPRIIDTKTMPRRYQGVTYPRTIGTEGYLPADKDRSSFCQPASISTDETLEKPSRVVCATTSTRCCLSVSLSTLGTAHLRGFPVA